MDVTGVGLSVLFLATLTGAALAWALIAKHRLQHSWFEIALYFPCFLLARFLWRTDFPPNGLPIPRGTGCILISNHRSSVDPFFLQVVARRRVHWMVAKEFCDHPLFGPFLRGTQAIPTRRGGGDLEATRQAIRYVQAGECLGIFPEGRINFTARTLLPVRPGAVMVALRTGVPIIPCYIEGSPYNRTPWSPLLMPAHVKVRIGRPIVLERSEASRGLPPETGSAAERNELEDLTRRCVREILRLAGRGSEPIELAGRNWKPDADMIERERRTGQIQSSDGPPFP